jgi:hypothetical protein
MRFQQITVTKYYLWSFYMRQLSQQKLMYLVHITLQYHTFSLDFGGASPLNLKLIVKTCNH